MLCGRGVILPDTGGPGAASVTGGTVFCVRGCFLRGLGVICAASVKLGTVYWARDGIPTAVYGIGVHSGMMVLAFWTAMSALTYA